MTTDSFREHATAIIDSEKSVNVSYMANGPLHSHAATAAMILVLCDRLDAAEEEILKSRQKAPKE